MAITDYPLFTTEDTLHQQVDKLVLLVGDVDSNNESILSSVTNINSVFDFPTSTWSYTDSVTTNATDIKFTATKDFDVNAVNLNLIASSNSKLCGNDVSIVADGDNGGITLDAKDNLFNVVLKSNGSTYGVLRNNGGNLTIRSSVNDVIVLNGTTLDATFQGTITMPSASVDTTAKDVAGAINELKALITALQTQVDNL